MVLGPTIMESLVINEKRAPTHAKVIETFQEKSRQINIKINKIDWNYRNIVHSVKKREILLR